MWWCVLSEIPNGDKKNNENGYVFIYFNNWWQMKISTSFHLSIMPFRHVSRPPDKTQTQSVRTSRTFIFHRGDERISRYLIMINVASLVRLKVKKQVKDDFHVVKIAAVQMCIATNEMMCSFSSNDVKL